MMIIPGKNTEGQQQYIKFATLPDIKRGTKYVSLSAVSSLSLIHIYITGGLIQTQLSETTFKSKYGLRPIPITWLNTLSNGQEPVSYTHLDVYKRQKPGLYCP